MRRSLSEQPVGTLEAYETDDYLVTIGGNFDNELCDVVNGRVRFRLYLRYGRASSLREFRAPGPLRDPRRESRDGPLRGRGVIRYGFR